MRDIAEFSITRASLLIIPNTDWTHYRLGLKLRCTSDLAGVTLAVISQGKTIDSTEIKAGAVKFLTKLPIVGVKVLSGDKLLKRLQMTFASEGNYNMFANKIKHWLGIEVATPPSESFGGLEVPESQVMASQVGQSQVSCSQYSQPTMLHDPSQAYPSQVTNGKLLLTIASNSQIPELSYPSNHNYNAPNHQAAREPITELDNIVTHSQPMAKATCQKDPFLALLEAAAIRIPTNGRNVALSQSSNCIGNQGSTKTTFADDTSFTTNENSSFASSQFYSGESSSIFDNQTNALNLNDTLADIPFRSGIKKLRRNRQKSSNFNSVLEKIIVEIMKDGQGTYLGLNDEDLTLKIARRLNCKSFLKLLERVESILEK